MRLLILVDDKTDRTNANANDDIDNSQKTIRLGLRPNINQFLILVLVNAFVGAMVGLEQTVVPSIGKDIFHIESTTLIVSFIASFGMVKAILNLFAGNFSDRWGRKKCWFWDGYLVYLSPLSYCLLQIGTG